MLKIFTLSFLMILSSTASSVEPSPDEKLDVAQSYIRAANNDDPAAQFLASNLFWNGWGVQKNDRLARGWLEKSAAQSYPEAILELGRRKLTGDSYELDVDQGLALVLRSSDLGVVHADVILGAYYLGLYSNNSLIDSEKGKVFLLKASSLNSSQAMYYLGLMYELGREPDVSMESDINYERSIYWYTQSAEKLNTFSIGRLGLIYALPQNDNLDWEKAYFWFKVAQKLDYNYWSDYMVNAELNLNSGSRTVVKKKVEQWLNIHSKIKGETRDGGA